MEVLDIQGTCYDKCRYCLNQSVLKMAPEELSKLFLRSLKIVRGLYMVGSSIAELFD